MLLFFVASPNSAPPRRESSSATETERKAIFLFVMCGYASSVESRRELPSPRQPFLRIFRAIVVADLEVEVAGLRALALADPCNRLPRRHPIAYRHRRRLDIAVEREDAIAVVQNDQVSVSLEPLGK